MKKIIILWLFMGVLHICNSQVITIKDIETGTPLETVILENDSLKISAKTNAGGQADITAFKGAGKIKIRKSGYKTEIKSYAALEKMQFELLLFLDVTEFGGVGVSGNRWEKGKLETPNRVEKINMKEASFQNPQTTADLLGTSGYAFIQKSQLGGGSPMLRGYATNRVLFVVDGVRMNTAIFRAGNLQNVISLDANAMESTEILFGPGSVMYGSDAIGGVMSFVTLEPKLSDSGSRKLQVSGNGLMRTSTANSENTRHLDLNLKVRKLSFVTSFTRSDYGDLRSGTVGGVNYFYRQNYVQTIDNKDYMVRNEDSALQVGSKYSQTNFMQKVRFKPNKAWDIDYGFHFSQTTKFNRYDRLYVMQTSGPYKEKLRWAEWYYGPQKWNMQRVGITHTKATRAYDQLRIVGAVQNFEESRYEREFMFREVHMQQENVKAVSINLDMEKKLDSKSSLQYGTELVRNKVSSIATLTHVITKEEDSTVTRYPDGSTWECFGAYVNLRHKLTKKLTINGGARFSYYRIKADFDTLVFPFPFSHTVMKNDALNGSLGFVYTPHKSLQVYANAATGFRAPNIDDMGKVFESTPGYLVVPNPTLKAEKVYNMEVGAVKTFGSFLRVDFAAYQTFLEDAMVRKDFMFNGQPTIRYLGNPSRIQAIQNVTQIRVHGIQAGVDFSYRRFGLKSTISYQNGKEQSPDSLVYYPLRHAAPTFGSTHITYNSRILKLDFYTVYNAKMDYNDLALTERINTSYAKDEKGLNYSSGWYTLNFKTAFYVNRYVVIMAGVENITDILYRPYSSGINAPGRNFIAALRTRF